MRVSKSIEGFVCRTRRRFAVRCAAERDEKGNILVAITENDEIWIDKRRVDLKAVRANIERLKIEYPEGSVIIQADKEARSGLLVETMDQIRLAGVQNISIAAKNDN